MNRMTHCRLLRPCLVAHVYGEPHPEEALLLRHLEGCPECLQELESLSATRWCVETTLADAVRPRWLRAKFAANILVAVAAAVLALAIVVDRGSGAVDRAAARPWAGLQAVGPSTFDGAELDGRIADVRRRLAVLEVGLTAPEGETW